MEKTTYLDQIKLTAFRNYQQLNLSLDGRHVVLSGPNGSGKTNLIEAVSLLSPGRGLRRASAAQMIHKDASPEGFSVFARLVNHEDTFEIGTGAFPSSSGEQASRTRRVRINGTTAKSSDELLDLCRIIWLTPAMDGLFTGPAADRRRFLDRMVLAIDPAHGQRANAYERAMRQRNKLLEDSAGHLRHNRWLDGIEEQLASLGIAIQAARSELVQLLTAIIAKQEADQFPSAMLTIGGELEELAHMQGCEDAAAHETAYRRHLQDMRPRDQAARRTLVGVHRSDLFVTHAQKDMEASLCSTGEQKALLVGLILSHGLLTKSVSGHAPIMLFDEIAAHLDVDRRAALFERVDALGGQAFMTGTDRNLFDAMKDKAQRFRVEAGTVSVDD
ncbi:MAG: DNA replication/repair protein RecF [Pseudomonadota bacterium]